MSSRNLIRLAVLVAPLSLPLAIRADETPADAKSTAKPEAQASEKRAEQLFKELDKNGDGKLTADEIPEDRRTFFDHLVRTGDKDKNGELTLAEFVEGLKPAERRAAPDGDRPGRRDGRPMMDFSQLFQRWDRNGDGKLSLNELPEPAQDRMKGVFNRLGKTEIDRDDFARVAGRLRGEGGPPMPGERGRMDGRGPLFFRKLDKNADGKLSKEELQDAARIFDELDANEDGLLDVREMFGPPPGVGDGVREESRLAPPAGESASPATDPAGRPLAAAANASEKPAPPAVIAAKGKGAKAGKGPLRRLDANGDGKISRDEAQGKLRKNFHKLDADGDGFLERGELRKALQDLKPGKPDPAPKA